MRKVILADRGRIEYLDVPKPETRPGWVRVRILRNGLCGTDVHNYYKETIFGKDCYPFNMGHEAVGIADEVGEGVRHIRKGDTVVINPIWTCGCCEACQSGENNACENLTTIGLVGPSGNSEYTLAPARAVVKADENMDPALLAFTEPLGTVVYGADKLRFDGRKDVLIIGAGAIGLLFLQYLKIQPVRSITVEDMVDSKLETARSLGATKVRNPSKGADESRYDIIIDCTGNPYVAESLVGRAAFSAQILIFGVCPIDSEIRIRPFDIYKKNLSIFASYTLSESSFRRSLSLIESGRVDVKPLLFGVYPVGKLEECIHAVKEGKVSGKIVIDTTVF